MHTRALGPSWEVNVANYRSVFYSFFSAFTYRDLHKYIFFLNKLNSFYVYYLVTLMV